MSLQLSLVMSVMIALITSIYCADILRIMRTPENIFEGAYAYLLVTFIGVPCTFLYNLLSSIIRALGDSKTLVKGVPLIAAGIDQDEIP